jgi:hypothetical protein
MRNRCHQTAAVQKMCSPAPQFKNSQKRKLKRRKNKRGNLIKNQNTKATVPGSRQRLQSRLRHQQMNGKESRRAVNSILKDDRRLQNGPSTIMRAQANTLIAPPPPHLTIILTPSPSSPSFHPSPFWSHSNPKSLSQPIL